MISRWVLLVLLSAATGAKAADAGSVDNPPLDIPSTDVNFGKHSSSPDEAPQTGPILHRKFAEKWRKESAEKIALAEEVIARAATGACGDYSKSQARGWADVLESARLETRKGQAKWDTVAQLATRHYMRAARMADNLLATAERNRCKLPP
ncbi:MAG: hypothetical protein ACKVP2_10645 [Burkholderiales bacterium]